MLQPLSWMFKTKDFKKYFWTLCSIDFGFNILALILFISVTTIADRYTMPVIIVLLFSFIIFIIPYLFVSGYFWELTFNIIGRDTDISASEIYNGKIKQSEKIELPKIKFFRFIWRGIASIVATIMLILPIILIILSFSKSTVKTFEMFSLNPALLPIVYLSVSIFICLFIPALLHNYAYRDSVFAVLNLRRAVYLMGNYPFRYLWNTFLLFIFSVISAYILRFLSGISGVNFDVTNINTQAISNIHMIIAFAVIMIITIFWRIYSLFVNAYLLGTLAPKEEF